MGRARTALIAALVLGCADSPESGLSDETQAVVSAAPAEATETTRSVGSGVYSSEQASRGRQTYLDECAACHLPDLSGDDLAPALRGEAFLSGRLGFRLGDLYAAIRSTMPLDREFSLAPQEYVDILAYLLSENGAPPGPTELAADQATLDLVVIDSVPAARD